MAIKPSARYPAQTDADAAYPQGKARNSGTFQDGTGTPFEKDLVNDIFGFQQALLLAADLTPSESPDTANVSQYLEAVRTVATQQAAAHDLATRALALRALALNITIANGSPGMAAVAGRTAAHPVMLLNAGTDMVFHAFDWSLADSVGTIASSIASGPVFGAARAGSGTRVVVIGASLGGGVNRYTDDEGLSWTDGSALAATPQDIVYNETHSRFMVTFGVGVDVAHDTDGASTWTSVSTGLTSAQSGIAVLSNGDTVAAGLDGDGFVAFAVSDDGGASWALAGDTVPDFGDYVESGWVCGDEGAAVYHAGRALGGTVLRVCSSADGENWSLLAEFDSPGASAGVTFASQPRILRCQTTGLLVLTCTLSNGPSVAYASVDDGFSWSEPTIYASGGVAAAVWSVANGRVFAKIGSRIFASDGVAKV